MLISPELIVDQPDSALGVVVDSIVAAVCPSDSGMINITVTGGTAPYSYSWDNGDTTQNIMVPVGDYVGTITDANGCSVEDSVVVEGVACVTTSLEDELSAGISVWEVFPNPSSSKINLSVSLESAGNLQLSLVDVQGRTLRQVHVENTRNFNESWNLERMTPGMYFIRIETDKGTASRTLLVQ